MLIDLSSVATDNPVDCDIIVIGAGAVGLPLAVKLARAGKTVALLEAGREGLRPSSQSLFEAARSLSAPHAGLHGGRFRMLGGTSNFWGGQLVRFEPHIFAPRPWLGDGLEWPIARNDLDPYYEEAFSLLGMSNVVRSDTELIERLGLNLPSLGSTLQYFFTRWTPQPELTAHFERDLTQSPHLNCYIDAQVTKLDMSVDGTRVENVFATAEDGRARQFRARDVVLANGTIEIARLLMQPLADGRDATWVSNRWLGRGFIDHLDVTAGRLHLLDERRFRNMFENVVLDGIKYQPKVRLSARAQEENRYCDISAHLIFNSSTAEHFANAKIFLRSFLKGRFDRDLKSYPQKIGSLLRVGLPMMSRYLRDNRVYAPADGGIDLRLTAEQLPADSRILLSDRVDSRGMHIADLDWHVGERELETMAGFALMVAEGLEAARLARVAVEPALLKRDPSFIRRLRDSNHQMGGARMGESDADGVVDSESRVFGTSNLHVAGAATYRAAGFPNPTFTAIALALRLGTRLLERVD